MNRALGNVGKTVIHTEPLEADPVDQVDSLRDLVRDMDSGAVEMLVILGANPIYTAPADIPFAEKFAKVKTARAARPLRQPNLRALPLAYSRSALSRDPGRQPR